MSDPTKHSTTYVKETGDLVSEPEEFPTASSGSMSQSRDETINNIYNEFYENFVANTQDIKGITENIITLNEFASKKSSMDINAQYIIRKHYLADILKDLKNIQVYCGTASAAVFAGNILNNIIALMENNSKDPFTEIAMALYDAMAYENYWINYTAEQYEGAFKLFDNLYDNKFLKNEKIEKGLIVLHKLGFIILPFQLGYDKNV